MPFGRVAREHELFKGNRMGVDYGDVAADGGRAADSSGDDDGEKERDRDVELETEQRAEVESDE